MIILYTVPNCKNCTYLENLLTEKNIEFKKSQNLEEMIELGITSAPTLRVGSFLLPFIEAQEWINKQEVRN